MNTLISQTNGWRLDICGAKDSGSYIQDISRNIRATFGSIGWDGKAIKDKEFNRFRFKIIRLIKTSEKIKASLDAADKSTKLDSTTLKSKTVQLGFRGRKVLNDNKIIEGELRKCILKRYKWEETCCGYNHILTGTYHQKIFPWWSRVSWFSNEEKNWYCRGLKKTQKLSIRQVNGVGKNHQRIGIRGLKTYASMLKNNNDHKRNNTAMIGSLVQLRIS